MNKDGWSVDRSVGHDAWLTMVMVIMTPGHGHGLTNGRLKVLSVCVSVLFTIIRSLVLSSQETVSLGCDLHGGRHVCSYYCYDCDTPACAICLLYDHGPPPLPAGNLATFRHSTFPPVNGSATPTRVVSHRTVKLRDALAGRREALKNLLNALGPPLDRLESRVKRLGGGGGGSYSSQGGGYRSRSGSTNVGMLSRAHSLGISGNNNNGAGGGGGGGGRYSYNSLHQKHRTVGISTD